MKNNYDSFSKFQSKCKKNTIEISINIQKDYQIPEFDMIKDIKYDENGFNTDEVDLAGLCEEKQIPIDDVLDAKRLKICTESYQLCVFAEKCS